MLCLRCEFRPLSLAWGTTELHPGGSALMQASHSHYGWAAIVALALVIIPWALIGWLIWTLV